MKKKLIVLITVIVILLILAITLIIAFIPKNNNDNAKLIPFVEANNIEILSADKKFSNPVNMYTCNKNGDVINLEGITFDKSIATYKFYGYNESEEDENGYKTFSFKYDTEVPIKYYATNVNRPSWYYSYSEVSPIIFDYYTGDCYNKKVISIDNTVKELDGDVKNNKEENMKYTDISWNNKTYKIGVSMETKSKWDGGKAGETKNNITSYTDTDRATITVKIYAPKDYDGLMIGILKRGSSSDSFKIQYEEYKKLLKLQEEAEKSGKKSEELIKLEEKRNKIYKLFESTYDENLKYNKDDFDVIRVNDIKKQ